MKINENTNISLPVRNLLALCAAVAMGIFAYTEITSRLTSLETSRELHQADLLKKSEQLPTDQEQFMLLEHIAGQVENIQKEMETWRKDISDDYKFSPIVDATRNIILQQFE